ncbi:MAG: HigA family addiction module antidote protein [Deltaproteobacteria bacterium]|nr:HigA family addiction module antidote protein [Deltaproteobacteria bacterium]
MKKKFDPIHPGEILQEEFLTPLNISQSKLARDIDVPHRRINEIVLGKRAITPDTAMRFSVYFGTSAEFWMNLQTTYDLRVLSQEQGNMYDKLPHIALAA